MTITYPALLIITLIKLHCHEKQRYHIYTRTDLLLLYSRIQFGYIVGLNSTIKLGVQYKMYNYIY